MVMARNDAYRARDNRFPEFFADSIDKLWYQP